MSPAKKIPVWWRALRLHQWLKNTLVFVPLLAAQRLDEPAALALAALAFLAMGLCASSGYLINDLLDLTADREHVTKRLRPLAAGELPVSHAKMAIAILASSAALIALALPKGFLVSLCLYFAIAVAYSLWLKKIVLLDVLVLAVLYTLRITAGAAAVTVVPSFWLLAFSLFLFLSLALLKRYTELKLLLEMGKTAPARRGYVAADLDTLSSFGSATACMAVLVLALYINSEAVVVLYSRPAFIWLLCPLLLMMLARLWLLARRGELHEDPVVFVILDRTGQLLALLGALLLWLAI